MGRSRSHGFTLVELLVVIAIISVLAGLLLPVLRSAVEGARSIACLNNEKQVGMYVLAYAEDCKGAPPGPNPYPRFGSKLYSQGYLTDMLSSWNSDPRQNGIFACPAESDTGSSDSVSGHGYRGSHYGQVENPKNNILSRTLWDPGDAGKGYYEPGRGAVLGDACAGSMPHQLRNSKWHIENSFNDVDDLASWFHNGGWDLWRHPDRKIGVWFADGHAKQVEYWEPNTFPP